MSSSPLLPLTTSLQSQIPAAPHADLRADEYSQALTFEYARFINQNTTEYIRLADSKAAILVTLLSANLLVLVQRTADAVSQLHNKHTVTFLILGCLYATASLAGALNTIRPRVARNAARGHIFWEDIVAHTKNDYINSVPNLRVGDIYRELAEHNHNLANTAMRKFRWLRVSFLMALTSIVVSAILILFTS